MGNQNVIVFWRVCCVRRDDHSFFDRDLILDLASVTQEEQQRILQYVDRRTSDRRITDFRHKFEECDWTTLKHRLAEGWAMESVVLDDYFEDEKGNPLDEIGLSQAVSGQEDPIIMGNPKSVTCLGPAGMIDKDKWTAKKANDIAQLLDLVERILESGWLHQPLRYRCEMTSNRKSRCLESDYPDTEHTSAAILSIRQLYSADDAFNLACNSYLQHVGDERKKYWIKERKHAFNVAKDTRPFFFTCSDYTRKEVIDLFIYGSALFHRNSDKDVALELQKEFGKIGEAAVIMSFNEACREICQFAFDVYPVLRQDFLYWIHELGCAAPDRPNVSDLLRRHRTKPTV